ncbi:MAG: DUF6538 domain-containing protein [Terasakiella sp.]|uniref:DUF6538 domain-containing protein n=1 Tax=unclassified Terasakiella TaxID=2614952 RepID=UPI003AFFE812
MVGLKDRLYLRGKTYWYQRYIPERYRPHVWSKFGKGKFVKKSTKTRDYNEAVLVAKAFDLEVEIMFRFAEKELRPKVITDIAEGKKDKAKWSSKLPNLGEGGITRQIFDAITNELASMIMPDEEERRWATPNMSAEELIANAFENTKIGGSYDVPSESLIQQMKPELIKQLLFEAGNAVGNFNTTVNNVALEEAATNLIKRELKTPMATQKTVAEFIEEFYDTGPKGGKKSKRLYQDGRLEDYRWLGCRQGCRGGIWRTPDAGRDD